MLAFVASACVACAAPWPGGYREAVCAATDHLRAADEQLAAAVEGVALADQDRLEVAAAGMEREAIASVAALESAPGWGPAGALEGDLRIASTAFARAARLFAAGARQGNGPALDLAVAIAQEAEAALGRAERDGDRLHDANGWQPC